ncbi:P-loop containing nucleoside triphosphate hydrolase protein [Suillus clintonianus]|uniref:P-loop containing nucleoside triphosphate hydrolase protein n=1 Tax=Suillus clintonianus TaxID=1904413 RepID=UPI001B882620|nr:P-loop containing nucleoside triphosphate hydrolase protein [Suillus clintonianus]KAG2147594.1 P-loop containing nucleoside triphosphate hydrolase protein [Suillus clintonianus]
MTGALSIRIAIMGPSGSGKTTFINEASGTDFAVGKGLESCTNEVQATKPFKLNGREVTLIDTPGFDDTSRSDTDILAMIGAYLSQTYEHGAKLAGIIYMHRISDFRMGGTNKRNFKMFRELCGESTLRNVLIVTNMWSEVASDLGEIREKELENNFFKAVLDKGARMLRHEGTRESTHRVLRYLIHNQPATLLIQKELVNEHKNIVQTSAGSELTRVLNEQRERHEEVMAQMRKDMEAAIRDKDLETKEELKEEIRSKHDQILKLQGEKDRLEAEFKAAKERLDARISAMEEKHREQGRTVDALQEQLEMERKEREKLAVEQEQKEQRLRRLEEDNARAQELEHLDSVRELDRLAAVRVELQQELRKEEQQSTTEPEVNEGGLIENVVTWVRSWWS